MRSLRSRKFLARCARANSVNLGALQAMTHFRSWIFDSTRWSLIGYASPSICTVVYPCGYVLYYRLRGREIGHDGRAVVLIWACLPAPVAASSTCSCNDAVRLWRTAVVQPSGHPDFLEKKVTKSLPAADSGLRGAGLLQGRSLGEANI